MPPSVRDNILRGQPYRGTLLTSRCHRHDPRFCSSWAPVPFWPSQWHEHLAGETGVRGSGPSPPIGSPPWRWRCSCRCISGCWVSPSTATRRARRLSWPSPNSRSSSSPRFSLVFLLAVHLFGGLRLGLEILPWRERRKDAGGRGLRCRFLAAFSSFRRSDP